MKNTDLHYVFTPLSFALQTAFLLLGLMCTTAWGQALPPTGQVGRELTPSLPSRDENPISTLSAPSSTTSNSAVSVEVKAFAFTGNTNVGTEELQVVVAPYLNQKLDLEGLDKVADRISGYYREKGFTVARAYLPPQESADGVIKFAVIEGSYSAVNIRNNSLVKDEMLRLIMSYNLCDGRDGKDCTGAVVQDKGLERAILLIKDLPGVTATASLKPGQSLGTSELDVTVNPVKYRAYSLGFDNFGTPATGVTRLNFNADLQDIGANGADQLSLGIATTTTTDTKTGTASYSIPVGYRGQRAGIALSRNQYRLGAGFSATQSHGTSNALSAYTSYPIQRSVNKSFYVRGSVEFRGALNEVGLIGTSYRTHANVARLGITGDNVDSIYGGGYNTYALSYSQGYVGTTDPADSSATGAHSAGRFGKVIFSAARQQALNGPVTVYGSLSGQIASKNLDGSEQTGLGGPASVRGYGGEAGGSKGAGGTVELRYTEPVQIGSELSNITYALFVDRGWVQFYQIQPTGSTGANTRALSSYGITLTLQSAARVPTPTSTSYYLRGMLGLHSMSPAQQSAIDVNSKGRFWIQGGYNF